ncbi:hypothetical protein ACQHIH_21825 (plasmid) [Xanthomonas sontii]|uniref:Type VI secretion protein n=1 Tax=Xanthomonas sacchari TaxID=56458 RepID=A0ABT3DUW9_9XANT|nr:hypothetical protein [Xanthomonas sacchari]
MATNSSRTLIRQRFLVPIGLLLSTLLCAGCTPHLRKSEGCMDEPLRNYLHKDSAGQ